MTKLLVVAVALLLLSACDTGQDSDEQRRAQYLAANPELKTTTIGNDFSNGEIFSGMTEPEVAASWGEPCHSLTDESGELWDYCSYGEDHYVHFNEDGIVVSFTD